MQGRHLPRLCGTCDAPMARQEDACWHCGAPWADREQTVRTSRVLFERVPAGRARTDEVLIPVLDTADPAILIPA
jgi:hypothetical protein